MLTGRCIKAPPERKDFPRPGEDVTAGDKRGNLDATNGSGLRGSAVPLGELLSAARLRGSPRHPALQKGKMRLKNGNIG